MAALRYGIIGFGVIGPVHAQAISALPETELLAVCDIVEKRAQNGKTLFGARKIYSDYRDLLARDDIDAVCICTPHYLHAEMAIAAARAGKHILCEKPMALSPTDMDAMIDAADRAGVQLGVCFQHRFDPVAVQLKQLVDEGKLGTPLLGGVHVYCTRDADYYSSEVWRGKWATEGGGVLINQAIHTIDLLLWIFGEALSITGKYGTLRWQDIIEVEDTASGIIDFAGGAQGHIVATSASNLDWMTRLRVMGSEGTAEINTGCPNEYTFFEVNGTSVQPPADDLPLATVGKSCYGNSHLRALNAFTRAVLDGTPFSVDGREARRAAEVVLGLFRSSREKKTIPLPLTD